VTATTVVPAASSSSSAVRAALGRRIGLLSILAGALIFSIVRAISDQEHLTSSSVLQVAVRQGMPIAMAGLAGLYAERSGTINIGIEGMMIMGTIFAGWWGWYWNPWMAIVGGLVGGVLAGLLHAVATINFGVNHVVSGVAINLIAPGIAQFMAGELFTGQPGGSISNSPGNSGKLPEFTMPFISGGDLFGWKSPDPLGWLEERKWFLIGDVAGVLRGLTSELTFDLLIAVGFIVLAWYLLWRTPLGLRLRASGEKPSAPDSLGVSVMKMRYIGMILSGAMAGFGGAIIELFTNRYQRGQTTGQGFLGLATLIFGNWRASGLAAGSALFGYAQAITLRAPGANALVNAMFLVAALALLLAFAWALSRQRWIPAFIVAVAAALSWWAYVELTEPADQVVKIFPYVLTLIVVAARSQSLRPPAAEGIPYFKGMQG
jgi:general nucleoside transport system permease protein